MSIAEIKTIYSPDIEVQLRAWKPEPIHVLVLIEMEIGLVDEEGGDIFSIVVATPAALEDREQGTILGGRGFLLVRDWDYPAVFRYLRDIVANTSGHTWPAVSAELNRHFFWEYESMNHG